MLKKTRSALVVWYFHICEFPVRGVEADGEGGREYQTQVEPDSQREWVPGGRIGQTRFPFWGWW